MRRDSEAKKDDSVRTLLSVLKAVGTQQDSSITNKLGGDSPFRSGLMVEMTVMDWAH